MSLKWGILADMYIGCFPGSKVRDSHYVLRECVIKTPSVW
jgi:hypothetical protein